MVNQSLIITVLFALNFLILGISGTYAVEVQSVNSSFENSSDFQNLTDSEEQIQFLSSPWITLPWVTYQNWEYVYSYINDEEIVYDEYTQNVVSQDKDSITIKRAYINYYEFSRIIAGKIEILQLEDEYVEYQSDDLTWLGARLIIANPDNLLEKFEVRLYPEDNPFRDEGMIQVNYVDKANNITSILASNPCDIEINKTYSVIISKAFFRDSFKAVLLAPDKKTCEISWENNDIIHSEKFSFGIQSAGRYVVSKFSKLTSY